MGRKHAVLVDLHPLIYASYYGVQGRSSATVNGTLVSAVRPTIAKVLSILQHPSRADAELRGCFVDPLPDNTGVPRGARGAIMPSYQESRQAPPDIIPQLTLVKEGLERSGIPCIGNQFNPAIEADDLIATYADLASAEGHRVTIVSPDKDMLQMVRNDDNRSGAGSIAVFDPNSNKLMHRKQVIDQWGVEPSLMPGLLTLLGHRSLKIAAVGLSKQQAARAVQRYRTLPQLFRHINPDHRGAPPKDYQGLTFQTHQADDDPDSVSSAKEDSERVATHSEGFGEGPWLSVSEGIGKRLWAQRDFLCRVADVRTLQPTASVKASFASFAAWQDPLGILHKDEISTRFIDRWLAQHDLEPLRTPKRAS